MSARCSVPGRSDVRRLWGLGFSLRAGQVSSQFPKTNSGMLQTPLTPSLSPSDGESRAEGRVRGLPANPPIVIGTMVSDHWLCSRKKLRNSVTGKVPVTEFRSFFRLHSQ